MRRLVEGPAARLALAGDEAGARRVALGELDAVRRRVSPVGIAHIVGAGPGDPDLLTLRAAQLLQEADAILHDELVPSAILGRARRDAELVAVGKRKGQVGWAQADIEAELVRRLARPGFRMLDIGANVGFYALAAAAACTRESARDRAIGPGPIGDGSSPLASP